MKTTRKIVTIGTVLFLTSVMILFQNFTERKLKHEVFFNEGRGIPLSEIIASYPIKLKNNIEIRADEIAYIDESIDVDQLTINGQLHCDNSMAPGPIEIKARVIYVNGTFQCGSTYNRYQHQMTISLKAGNVDPKTSPAYRGLIVNSGGKLIVAGRLQKSGWVRLNQTAEPGESSIVVDESVTGGKRLWEVGDEIVIGPTSYASTEAETFTIAGVSGNEIQLNGTLQFRHWGETETHQTKYSRKIILDQRAEVANLKRNILIRPDESSGAISTTATPGAELGGHVMVMHGGSAYVDGIELYRMGQAGVMARYPFHWHIVGNAPGQFIKNSSIHRSFQRCITVHRTHQATVHQNTCYDFKGHGFFLEDGNEVDNVITSNLGIKAKFPHQSKVLLASDSPTGGEASGRFPNVSTFWISNPRNTVTDNIASGSVGSGFWMAFEAEVKDFQGNVVARPISEITKEFSRNTAHSAKVGHTWDGAPTGPVTGNPNNPNDRSIENAHYRPALTPRFDGLVAYKIQHTAFYFRGNTVVYDNAVSADNGWHYWLAYNQIIRNSVIIGKSQNHNQQDQLKAFSGILGSRIRQSGIVLYDGPFEANGIDFINYPMGPESFQYGNTTYNTTRTPFSTIGGTEKYMNTVQRIKFTPEPYHRAYQYNDIPYNSTGTIGTNHLRDVDGSLTGTAGSMLVSKASLGVLPTSGCVDGGTRFLNFKVCPPGYNESMMTFFLGDNNPNFWAMPFISKRSDGVLEFPKDLWKYVLGLNGQSVKEHGKIALANSLDHSYEVMFNNLSRPLVWLTSEFINPVVPVVKVVAQGKNCLLSGASPVSSLEALKSSTVTAYYTQGDDFYYRLLPIFSSGNVVANPFGNASTAFASGQHYIECPGGKVTQVIKGYVDSVKRESLGASSVIVNGWACNFNKDKQIFVKLYVNGPLGSKLPQYVQTVKADLDSEEAVSFACGVPNTTGFRYKFTIPSDAIEAYIGQKVYVQGVSTSLSKSAGITNSGTFVVPPKRSLIVQPVGPFVPAWGGPVKGVLKQ